MDTNTVLLLWNSSKNSTMKINNKNTKIYIYSKIKQ